MNAKWWVVGFGHRDFCQLRARINGQSYYVHIGSRDRTCYPFFRSIDVDGRWENMLGRDTSTERVPISSARAYVLWQIHGLQVQHRDNYSSGHLLDWLAHAAKQVPGSTSW